MDWIRGNLEFVFRWIHVVAGIMWIGHLYFFNFVNAQVAKAYDPDSKKKILPELMPRALYWFRWGAMYTWISGFFLLAFNYYMVPAQMANDPAQSNTADAGAQSGVTDCRKALLQISGRASAHVLVGIPAALSSNAEPDGAGSITVSRSGFQHFGGTAETERVEVTQGSAAAHTTIRCDEQGIA